jgi:exodeoxyribonuclease VII large subunit
MPPEPKIYTVTQVNSLVKDVLDAHLPATLVVRGEISGWKRHHSGHCYFSLKDEDSVLPCVMWSSSFARVRFKPEDGMAVLATGSVRVWTVGGRYQFYAEKLEPEGKGALQLAFEQMVKKLEAEGLFSDAHKKPIPRYPGRIGILTSESGAALHDIADSIHNRWPSTRLFLYPVPVQGEGAAAQIAAAIRDVNRRNRRLGLDVLIVGRGGGSLEDLWAFNEEVLARAIFESQIPIISAVGHEVDVTIADLVADKRASTPTKAGVVAVPDVHDVLSDLAHQQQRLAGSVRARLDLYSAYLRTVLASAVFRNPLLPVRNRQQYVDELAWNLADAARTLVVEARALMQDYHEGKLQLAARENRLAALNPKSVLKRGYSITTSKQTGRVVRRVEDVGLDELLRTELADENLIESRVTDRVKRSG